MEVTTTLARKIVDTTYDSLSSQILWETKRHILDTLGVMFPPTTLERACKVLAEIAVEGGGKTESTLVGFGGKVPCWTAAFVNGSLCHPMDYDDIADEFSSHPSAQTFPAALAIAERVGNASGKEFLTAIALGIDLNVRLSASPRGSLMQDYPWFPITIFGVFSSTAVAGKLLRLSHKQMVNAFGIALDRASGVTESIASPDSEIRAIRDGFGNREGLLAALMAKRGITACKDAIEKLFKVFYRNNNDFSLFTSDLGKEFWGLKVGFKPWPCCRVAHTYIKAGLDLAMRYDLNPERIEEVILTVGSLARDIPFNPIEEKQKPKLSISAKLSLPFIMGVVFTKRRVAIKDFLPENLGDLEVLELAKKVKPKFDPHLCEGALEPGVVEVRIQGGESYVNREELPYGHPRNPMSDEELVAKFKDCTLYAKKAFSEEKVSQLVERIFNLETVKSLNEITDLLA